MEQNKQNTNSAAHPASAPQGGQRTFAPRRAPSRQGGAGGDSRGKGGPRRGGPRERVRSEFDQKIINIRRVARVAAGGRRFNFSVAMVIGNRKGSVGVGLGKAGDTAAAIDKATRNARKNMITIPMTKTNSIPHEVSSKYCSAKIMIMPAPGRGVVAGSCARNIIEFAGLKDISAKIFSGSKNQLNIARATIQALSSFKPIPKADVKEEAKVAAK